MRIVKDIYDSDFFHIYSEYSNIRKETSCSLVGTVHVDILEDIFGADLDAEFRELKKGESLYIGSYEEREGG